MKRFLIVIPIGVLAFSLNFLPEETFSSSDETEIKVCTYQTDDKKCTFCHNDIIKHDVLHGPVADDCETCHQSTGNKHPRASLKGFSLVEKQPDLCYICHEQKNTKSHLHAPIEMGECNSCHATHGSNYSNLLNKESSSMVCNECHDIELGEGYNIHAPIELDGCQSCHDSHQSDHDYLLVDEKTNLCATCHDNINGQKSAEYQHAPFSDDCSNCHNPHSSKNQYLLTASSDELCFTCHDDIGQIMKDSKHIHKVADEGETCQNCHSPHASSNPKILKYKQEKLCFVCHNKEIKTENRTIPDINKKLKESKYKHSALEMGGCELCHNPHASDYNSLLTASFPEGDYAQASSSNFELCFTCHDPEMMESEFTETATNFRNGNINLHYVHIKEDKGRNCSICHDMHASNNKFLIKKRTQFGTWNMPMNFVLKAEGASCRTGCHTEKEYHRTEINNVQFIDNDSVHVENDSIIISQNVDFTDTLVVINDDPDTNITEPDTLVADKDDPDTNITEPDSLMADKDDPDSNITEPDSLVADKDDPDTNITEPDSLVADKDDPDTNITESDTLDSVKDDPIKNQIIDKLTKISANEAFNNIMPIKIRFNYAKDEIANEIDKELDKLVEFMEAYPKVFIEIGGHTDYIGSISYNIDLSRKRAQAIKRILNTKGILPQRLEIKAYGESYPIDTNLTDVGRANNRRVEFKIKKN